MQRHWKPTGINICKQVALSLAVERTRRDKDHALWSLFAISDRPGTKSRLREWEPLSCDQATLGGVWILSARCFGCPAILVVSGEVVLADRESSSRRDFLAGRSLRSEVEGTSRAVGDALLKSMGDRSEQRSPPEGGETLRLETRAMACAFSVILNPGEHQRMWIASDALELVHRLEQQMTVYRDDSELSQINQTAATGSVPVEAGLFRLLTKCRELADTTRGTFDPTSGPFCWTSRRRLFCLIGPASN